MVSTMVYQLTRGATIEETKLQALQSHYTEHDAHYSQMMQTALHLMLLQLHQLVILLQI